MNWRAISFDWNQARAFLVSAEEGSFSAAARALNLTQPTLGRQVGALEQHLGVILFERSGRRLTLTSAGSELIAHMRTMAEAAARVSLAASAQSQTAEGQVCITASDAISAYVLPEILARIQAIAPGLTIEILASNTITDLQHREADIAIRHVRPEQPELIARLVRMSSAHLFATGGFLDRFGRPRSPDDLRYAPFVGFLPIERIIEGLNALGLELDESNFRLLTENGVAGWEMMRRGLGICVMIREVARRTPGIEQVLPDLPPIEVPIWLTTHRELNTSRRIRVVFDLLADALAKG